MGNLKVLLSEEELEKVSGGLLTEDEMEKFFPNVSVYSPIYNLFRKKFAVRCCGSCGKTFCVPRGYYYDDLFEEYAISRRLCSKCHKASKKAELKKASLLRLVESK